MGRPRKLDLTGQSFGDWTVEGRSHRNARGEVYWTCFDRVTGDRRAVAGASLYRGKSLSAGSRQRAAVTTHGMTKTPTFKSWDSMKQRCLKPNSPDYERYGGRGIAVHSAWVSSFEAFLADMGVRPVGHTLDRIDVNGNYEPGNCRWNTNKGQQRNRREMVTITWRGESLTPAEWGERTGIASKILLWRIRQGWDLEKAMTTPATPGRGKPKRSAPS